MEKIFFEYNENNMTLYDALKKLNRQVISLIFSGSFKNKSIPMQILK